MWIGGIDAIFATATSLAIFAAIAAFWRVKKITSTDARPAPETNTLGNNCD